MVTGTLIVRLGLITKTMDIGKYPEEDVLTIKVNGGQINEDILGHQEDGDRNYSVGLVGGSAQFLTSQILFDKL
jgi:hypothetical protein